MSSRDRLRAIVLIWGMFAVFAGVLCHQNGVQVEDILLIALVAVAVVAATAELSGAVSSAGIVAWLSRNSTFSPPFDR